ncbi:MAG: GrpB family protein [Prolixibacteraceae bacterium]|nr:GrpB family protein [Prolixibacteraceae bacterium]
MGVLNAVARKGQAFHVHVRYSGTWNEVVFRDYLIEHPDVAKEYEKLKIRLATKHKNNREAYTEAQGDFTSEVLNITQKCRYWLVQSKIFRHHI